MNTEVLTACAVGFVDAVDRSDETGVLAGEGGDVDVLICLRPGKGASRREERGRECSG
ncbi:hypothetical protein ACFQZV_03745 [Microbacterium koreense]|uniref:Uncharacterized protein n=1 Tax=Microbacterium koreense TaxID=323761 RepID=A0ABW2ZP64_9MICO